MSNQSYGCVMSLHRTRFRTLNTQIIQILRIFLFSTVTLYKEATCSKELRFLGLMSGSGSSFRVSGSCLPAIHMAIESINRRSDILEGYTLTYNWTDTQCHAGTSLFRMFERLKEDLPYHMLLGPSCSSAAMATAQVSYMWNLTQLSGLSSSPLLSDRARFPRFFRTAMPDQKLNIARVALLQEFKWRKVVTVHQSGEFFSAVTEDFIQRIHGKNITILAHEIYANDPGVVIKQLKKLDARIIVTVMYEDRARSLICEAFKQGFYGSKIVWIFLGWYSSTFWKKDIEELGCSSEEMVSVVEGAFLTAALYENPTEMRGVANVTDGEFHERYYNHTEYSSKWRDTDKFARRCYDYVWTAALALNCTVQVLKEIGYSKTLDLFTYADDYVGKIIFNCMGNVSMIGVTGTTSFKEGADADKIAQIERIQEGKRDIVGLYRQDKDPSYFEWVDGALRWKNGKIPTDSAEVINKEVHIPTPMYIVLISLASLGICVSLSFLGFNVVFRNKRTVKLSSPNINNIMLVGCVICYMAVFFKTTGMENTPICRARVYSFSLGFTITFGSMFSKTWRVYRIFINKKLSRVNIQDTQLIAIICLMVAVVLLLLVIEEVVSPPEIKSQFLIKEVYMTAEGTEVRPFVRVCWSEYSTHFTWTLYIIEGVLLTFGTFLAWETRRVQIKELNDSQKIGICLYNVVILSAVGVTLSLLLDGQEVLMYGISSGCLFIGTTVTQLLIFIPKVHAVVNKIEVETISTMGNKSQMSAKQSTSERDV